MRACPRHHSKVCPETRRTELARDPTGRGKRRESTLCLSTGIGIASSFASSGLLRTRMCRSALLDALVCKWAVRGMWSAVLLPWRRRGGAVCASGPRSRLRFAVQPREETANRPSIELDHKVREVASNRHRRLERSRASRTTFTTVRQDGAARSLRCAEYCDEMANLDARATGGAWVGGICLGNGANSFRPWWSD
jgi:hypothetical protein